MRKWTATNAIVKGSEKGNSTKGNPLPKRSNVSSERAFHSQDCDTNNYVYCGSSNHVSSRCDKISTPAERRTFLVNKKLCFNCAAGQHSAMKCLSKLSCSICHQKTSVHRFAREEFPVQVCTTNVVGSSVIRPVVVVKVNDCKFRGASHSYVSSTLIDLIRARAVKSGTRRVAALLGVTTTNLSQYDLCIRTVKGDSLYTHVTRIDKRELLLLDNPRYAERIATILIYMESSLTISHKINAYLFI